MIARQHYDVRCMDMIMVNDPPSPELWFMIEMIATILLNPNTSLSLACSEFRPGDLGPSSENQSDAKPSRRQILWWNWASLGHQFSYRRYDP